MQSLTESPRHRAYIFTHEWRVRSRFAPLLSVSEASAKCYKDVKKIETEWKSHKYALWNKCVFKSFLKIGMDRMCTRTLFQVLAHLEQCAPAHCPVTMNAWCLNYSWVLGTSKASRYAVSRPLLRLTDDDRQGATEHCHVDTECTQQHKIFGISLTAHCSQRRRQDWGQLKLAWLSRHQHASQHLKCRRRLEINCLTCIQL